MKFCSQCGNPVTQRIPEGDSRLRFVCDSCQAIHYQNPNIVAGCVRDLGLQGVAVPTRHRATARLLDPARRFHGKR